MGSCLGPLIGNGEKKYTSLVPKPVELYTLSSSMYSRVFHWFWIQSSEASPGGKNLSWLLLMQLEEKVVPFSVDTALVDKSQNSVITGL